MHLPAAPGSVSVKCMITHLCLRSSLFAARLAVAQQRPGCKQLANVLTHGAAEGALDALRRVPVFVLPACRSLAAASIDVQHRDVKAAVIARIVAMLACAPHALAADIERLAEKLRVQQAEQRMTMPPALLLTWAAGLLRFGQHVPVLRSAMQDAQALVYQVRAAAPCCRRACCTEWGRCGRG